MTKLNVIADNHDVTINIPAGVIIDIDRSGSISDHDITTFLNEIKAINDATRKKVAMINFNEKCLQKVKKFNIRVRNKSILARFEPKGQVILITFDGK